MMPLDVLNWNHQSIGLPQLQPLCLAALVPMNYPEEMKARVSPEIELGQYIIGTDSTRSILISTK